MNKVYFQYGYTQKDIAEYLDVHYTTISRAIKRIEGEGKYNILRTRSHVITGKPNQRAIN